MDKSDILGSIDVNATIVGTRAKVAITQTFTNHGAKSIEASYTFPIPPKAMVQEFTLTLGDKKVTSTIEETETAYDAYDKAIQKGDTAGIIESVRKDILELSLGNITPGEVAKITLTYIQEIPCTDNKSQIRMQIPFVVAPRYENNPTTENKRIQPNIGENHTVVRLKVDIKEFSPIDKISSPSHRIQASIHGDRATVDLALENEKADSDFVLELIMSEDQSSFSYSNGTFTLIQVTPIIAEKPKAKDKQSPKIFGFLLDHSGSMEGSKLVQAKQALKLCLRQLNRGDSFTIIAFDDRFIQFSEAPLPYTDESMLKADVWIDAINADGGTEILAPLECLYKSISNMGNGIVLIFTDGQVSNEEQIISLVEAHQAKMTVFPFGIDTAVNESFINGVAEAGNGVPEFIYPGERIEDKVCRHFDRILSPSWENAIFYDTDGEELEVIPRIPGKLFPRETYTFIYRQESASIPAPITLKANTGGEEVVHMFKKVSIKDGDLPVWWALMKIRSLEKDLHQAIPRRQEKMKKEIIEISKEFGVLSTFTSLLAIFPRTQKVKGMPEYIKVPVCAPREWDMIHKPNLRRLSGKGYGGLPEAEPQMIMASASAPFGMSTTDIFNEAKTREDHLREVVLNQKVNGAISKGGKEDLMATILFILTFLLDSSAIQTYRKSIQKAVQYLLIQPYKGKSVYPLFQACAIQCAIQAKLADKKLLSDRIKVCLVDLTEVEKNIFENFTTTDRTLLWREIDSKIKHNDSWEEVSTILLGKILKFEERGGVCK